MSRWNYCFSINDELTSIAVPMLAYGEYGDVDLSFVVLHILDDLLLDAAPDALRFDSMSMAREQLLEFDIPDSLCESIIGDVKKLLVNIVAKHVPTEYSKRIMHRRLSRGEFLLELWIHDSIRENTNRTKTEVVTHVYETSSIAAYGTQ